MHTRTWNVSIHLSEQEGHTHAEAVLRTDVGPDLRHTATARRHPRDRDVPEIGDELAASRALAGLAHSLLDAAIADVAANSTPGAPGDDEPAASAGAASPHL